MITIRPKYGGIDILKTDLEFSIELDERLKALMRKSNFNAISEGFLRVKVLQGKPIRTGQNKTL
jgi:hypothetical protein